MFNLQLKMKDNVKAQGRKGFWMAVSLLAAACGPLVPATTPPQLEFSPGPPVVVTDRVYETVDFSVRYPSGWRIITGAADQPTSVVFAGLDEQATITLMVGPLQDMTFDRTMRTEIRGVPLDSGKTVVVIGRAPPGLWDTFLPIYEAVFASVQMPS